MQVVVCYVKGCGFHGEHNTCLNRLVVVNDQGVCNYVTRPGLDRTIEEKFKDKKEIIEGEG